jgi:hypothetical protein
MGFAGSTMDSRCKLYLDLRHCVDTALPGFVKCDIYDVDSRSGIVYFDSERNAERAFFMVVWDCDAVYLEEDTLVLRGIYERNPMWTI